MLLATFSATHLPMSDSLNRVSVLTTALLVDGDARGFGRGYFSFYFSYFGESLPAGQGVV